MNQINKIIMIIVMVVRKSCSHDKDSRPMTSLSVLKHTKKSTQLACNDDDIDDDDDYDEEDDHDNDDDDQDDDDDKEDYQ